MVAHTLTLARRWHPNTIYVGIRQGHYLIFQKSVKRGITAYFRVVKRIPPKRLKQDVVQRIIVCI